MATKKTAKKATKKTVDTRELVDGRTDGSEYVIAEPVQMRDYHAESNVYQLERKIKDCSKVLLSRHFQCWFDKCALPSDTDEIVEMIIMLNDLSFLNIDKMRGFSKIWDAIVYRWDDIEEASKASDWSTMERLLREAALPFQDAGNPIWEDVLY